jgi:hypothetical protein
MSTSATKSSAIQDKKESYESEACENFFSQLEQKVIAKVFASICKVRVIGFRACTGKYYNAMD